MKKIGYLLSGMLVTGLVNAGTPAHWGYSGEAGPANWAKLTPDNSACTGRNQSPINLTGFIEADLKPLAFNYQAGGQEILYNGHTVQINYAAGSSLEVDGTAFNLVQFHFHAPSENHVNGKSFPLEAHLVHADKDGNLAVLAVMFEEGAENAGLAKAWAQMPQKVDEKQTLSATLDVDDIIPADRDYYRFNGSLTTPPCSEGVRWLVLKAAATASKEQIEAFAHVLHHPNNRPLQAVNARPVLQ
jgi:carbonic anhydrase